MANDQTGEYKFLNNVVQEKTTFFRLPRQSRNYDLDFLGNKLDDKNTKNLMSKSLYCWLYGLSIGTDLIRF